MNLMSERDGVYRVRVDGEWLTVRCSKFYEVKQVVKYIAENVPNDFVCSALQDAVIALCVERGVK